MKNLFILMTAVFMFIAFTGVDVPSTLDEHQTTTEMVQSSGDALAVSMSIVEAIEAVSLSDAALEQVKGGYDYPEDYVPDGCYVLLYTPEGLPLFWTCP